MLHWWQEPMTHWQGLLLTGAWVLFDEILIRRRVAVQWAAAKGRLNGELQQLKQRRNLAEIATQQAEERARGR